MVNETTPKELVRIWVSQQKQKYGENWRQEVAKQMTESMMKNPEFQIILKRFKLY